jgi:hypothetical protein
MSSGLGPHLGHFVAPQLAPEKRHVRALRPALHVDPHNAINRALQGLLGPGLDRIARQVQFFHPTSKDALSSRVLGQPFVHSVLSNNDTWTLLGGRSLNGVLTAQQLSADSSAGIVTLTLPQSDLTALGDPSVIFVKPGDPAPGPPGTVFPFGFIVEVPAVAILFNPETSEFPKGSITVEVPLSQIPTAAQITSSDNQNNLSAIYGSTGPTLEALFQSGDVQSSPTAVPTVPGLRLVDALRQNHNFPDPTTVRFFRLMRIAADKKALNPNNLNATQAAAFADGLNAFLGVVNNWTTDSTAQLDRLLVSQTPGELVPTLIRGPLKSTLAVTAGVVQTMSLALPERIDVGYVFASNGDYGLLLSARGQLSTSVPSTVPNQVTAGDIQTEVSNAPSLGALGGWRIVEGLTEGSVLSGALAATNSNNVATFAASAGYGAGLEYGLAMRYTQLIPLGNVFTLTSG